MLVLLVEDNQDLASNVIEFLALDDIHCDYAADLTQAKRCLEQSQFDAIILDLNLPDGDGIDACRQWQQQALAPILMLTARGELEQRLAGFEAGADDYLVKPFAMAELVARLKAVGRRQVTSQCWQLADLELDFSQRQAQRRGQLLEISSAGWQLLHLLSQHSPNMVSKALLERAVWGDDQPDSDALRSHLYRLRQVIDKPFNKPLLHTIRGQGVALRESTDD